jgi:hypothetical protein
LIVVAPKIMIAAVLALALGGAGVAVQQGVFSRGVVSAPAGSIALTITSANGAHRFIVEQAATAAQQERGLMFRTAITADGGMLFWPYPPDIKGQHQPPQNANFWMKNTPSALDIVYIRADGTIAHIAENAVPFDETPLPSGEPVAAVLELKGGRAIELGIAQGDKVTWTGR